MNEETPTPEDRPVLVGADSARPPEQAPSRFRPPAAPPARSDAPPDPGIATEPTAPVAPPEPPAAGAPSGTSWTASSEGWRPPPPAEPGLGAAPRHGGAGKFLVGVLVGALVGGLAGGGIAWLTRDGGTTKEIVRSDSSEGSQRNTSVIAKPEDIQGIVAEVEPAVVAIRVAESEQALEESRGVDGEVGAGTGFVISSDGVIVTNDHVVEGGDAIEVTFTDGTSLSAEVLGADADNDLAVIKVEGEDLPAAELGSSSDLVVGDDVIAIGNALALEGGLSVTSGIVSAAGREIPTDGGAVLRDVIQTDASINPGNSGGPLVNSKGEVVGINTAIADPSFTQNVGFAISIDSAKPVIEDLRAGREIKRGFLGVATADVTPRVAREEGLSVDSGALVVRLESGSPAAEAGIERGDVIVSVDGAEIVSSLDVRTEVRSKAPGDEVEIEIVRGEDRRTVEVTLGEATE